MKAGRLTKTAVARNAASTLPQVFALLLPARQSGDTLTEADHAATNAVVAAEYYNRATLDEWRNAGWSFAFGRLPSQVPVIVATRGDERGYCSILRYPKAERGNMVEWITGQKMTPPEVQS